MFYEFTLPGVGGRKDNPIYIEQNEIAAFFKNQTDFDETCIVLKSGNIYYVTEGIESVRRKLIG